MIKNKHKLKAMTFFQLLSYDEREYINEYLLKKIELVKKIKRETLKANKELLEKYEELMAEIGEYENDILYYVRLTEKINNNLHASFDDAEEVWCLLENNKKPFENLKVYSHCLANSVPYPLEVINDERDSSSIKKATVDSIDYLLKNEKWYTTDASPISKRKAKKLHLKNMVIAVDFDGTLCENEYPLIGSPNYKLIRKLLNLQHDNTLILWTCRNGTKLDDAVSWCKDFGLNFKYVNENAKSILDKYDDIDSRKITADIYIDDKARATL